MFLWGYRSSWLYVCSLFYFNFLRFFDRSRYGFLRFNLSSRLRFFLLFDRGFTGCRTSGTLRLEIYLAYDVWTLNFGCFNFLHFRFVRLMPFGAGVVLKDDASFAIVIAFIFIGRA